MRYFIAISCVAGFCLFGLFAYFQTNDNSDPTIYERPSTTDVMLWLCFYAYIAVLHGIGVFRSVPVVALALGVLVCVLEMSFTAQGIWQNLASGHFTLAGEGMQASAPEVEQSREFIGALIALAAVCFLALQRRFWSSLQKADG
jgi:ribose/xylose/arabinose/galactoside ABC-type transport system permease subunit